MTPPRLRWIWIHLWFIVKSTGLQTYGLANRYQVGTIGEFCFTIPPGNSGVISSRNVVHTPDQNFLLIRQNDWGSLYEEHAGNLAAIGSKICNGDHSFLKEPLVLHENFTTYDLTMQIPPAFDKTMVYAVVTDCKTTTNLEYSLTFTNPGSFLKRHFSCQDIGLLELYACLASLLVTLGILYVIPAYRKLRNIDSQQMTTHCVYLAYFLQFLSVSSILLHLFVYSFNGQGLSALKYIAQMTEGIATVFLTSLVWLYAEGVSIETTSVPNDAATTRSSLITFSIVTILFFLWEQIRYKSVYVARLQSGDRLGGFGLSPYCALFGTREKNRI